MADSDDLIKAVGANIQEKASLIWSAADTLRGPYKPHEYGLVIPSYDRYQTLPRLP